MNQTLRCYRLYQLLVGGFGRKLRLKGFLSPYPETFDTGAGAVLDPPDAPAVKVCFAVFKSAPEKIRTEDIVSC